MDKLSPCGSTGAKRRLHRRPRGLGYKRLPIDQLVASASTEPASTSSATKSRGSASRPFPDQLVAFRISR